MDRNLALEVVRATEAAALASARLMGRGDKDGSDRAAVEAMHRTLSGIAMAGEVVIGQGERSQAPLLYTGEKVGRARAGDPEIEIALVALEGTKLCATGAANAISVIAMSEKGKLLRAPDLYMQKMAVGPAGYNAVDLTRPARENLRRVADVTGKYVEDLTVVILDRPRNEQVVREVREAGARIKLIGDGDLAGALNTCFPETGVDVLMGIGGAHEGVISAAALRCVGGSFQGRFVFRSPEEKERVRSMGIGDPDKVFEMDDLADGNVMFAATGVTNGDFLKGVRFTGRGAVTHSVVMRSRTATVRFVETQHHLEGKPSHGW
ncbi:MAG TPA: class II fructose-bisphosphatase [Anaeromyxobacteraceae bacterium]|nr:class II fructose-bisphosphatase [Anaeromyxobacteraceae bacterium]